MSIVYTYGVNKAHFLSWHRHVCDRWDEMAVCGHFQAAPG